MRYIVVNVNDPRDRSVEWYANVKNVIRYGLAKPGYRPGQYDIYEWPEGTFSGNRHDPVRAYKRV